MQVITFLNEKGGVGKTTLTREAGLAISQMGYKVLLIDADGQGDLSRSFGLMREPHFNDFARRPNVALNTLVQKVPEEITPYFLHIVVGNEETFGIAQSASTRVLVGTMASRMRLLAKVYDYCIIDTKPSPDQLHDALSLVTDWLIFPTDAEYFSAGEDGGLDSSFKNMAYQREQALGHGVDKARPLAIVPNKVRNTNAHDEAIDALKDRYGELVWQSIPQRTAVTEAQTIKTSLTIEAKNLNISHVIWGFAKRIVKETQEKMNV